MSEYRGAVLDPRIYRGETSPPAATLEDESRYGNDGAITGATWTRLPSGLWVQSYGGADSIDCGSGNSLNLGGFVTLIAWARQTTINNWGGIISKGNYNFSYSIYFRNDGANGGYINATGTSNMSGGSYSADTWYMSTLTYDKDAGANNIILYQNTTVVDTDTQTGDTDTVGDALKVGDANGLGKITGRIALPRVFNYPLSPAQIYKIYNAERSLFGV